MPRNPKRSPYADLIEKIMARKNMKQDPRHIEGYMRLAHPTLNGLSLPEFEEEVALCARLIEEDGVEVAEVNAQTFGL